MVVVTRTMYHLFVTQFGAIIECNVLKGNRGVAFIQFYNRTEAENGKMDAGWVVDICWLRSGLVVLSRIRKVATS